MESLIKYIEQKLKYYTTQSGDEYFDGMLEAYRDILDVAIQLRDYYANHSSES